MTAKTMGLQDAKIVTQAALAMFDVARFMARNQAQSLLEMLDDQEAPRYAAKIVELSETIKAMPLTHDQAGAGYEAVAHLHYFSGATHCYVFEKDFMGGVQNATALTVVRGDLERAEIGFVSIAEMVERGLGLDLDFTPCTLGAICKSKGWLA